jgi:hypothetical protein
MNTRPCLNVVLSVAFIFCSASAIAQRTAEIAGAGGLGCGEYLEKRKRNLPALDSLMVSWMNGYVSGYNQFSPSSQIKTIPSPPTLLAYVDKYCREQPLNAVKHAVDSLISDLGGIPYLKGQSQ